MNAHRTLLAGPLTRPLTDPIATLVTARHRRNVGHGESLGETTIWGRILDMHTPARLKGRSMS